MKFVYVATGGVHDYYAEQAYVSMYSLRKHNPGCHIVLATEAETLKTFTGVRARILEIVDELVMVEVPEDFSMMQRSRYIKTSIRQRIKGDFLYLDCDTVIMGELSELELVEGDVCAIRIQDSYDWSESLPHKWFVGYNKLKGLPPDENYGITDYHTGGVILARDNEKALAFYETWHRLWVEDSTKYGFHLDQCSLWRANRMNSNVIKYISPTYNVQMVHPVIALRYINDCKVFHYHSNSQYLKRFRLKNLELLRKIMEPESEPELNSLIDNVVQEYLSGLRIFISSEMYEWMDSPTVQLARRVSQSFPIVDRLISKVSRLKLKSKS